MCRYATIVLFVIHVVYILVLIMCCILSIALPSYCIKYLKNEINLLFTYYKYQPSNDYLLSM